MVIHEFSSHREGYLSVAPGELVEVLEEEGKYWLVCTIPSQESELEREGLVPADCLFPVTQGECLTSSRAKSCCLIEDILSL